MCFGAIACETEKTMFVSLDGQIGHHISPYLQPDGLSQPSPKMKYKGSDTGYSIIDGTYSNETFKNLKSADTIVADFKRTSLLLKSGFPIKQCRQLVRVQNTRQSFFSTAHLCLQMCSPTSMKYTIVYNKAWNVKGAADVKVFMVLKKLEVVQ